MQAEHCQMGQQLEAIHGKVVGAESRQRPGRTVAVVLKGAIDAVLDEAVCSTN